MCSFDTPAAHLSQFQSQRRALLHQAVLTQLGRMERTQRLGGDDSPAVRDLFQVERVSNGVGEGEGEAYGVTALSAATGGAGRGCQNGRNASSDHAVV
jgi:hypothetical protein